MNSTIERWVETLRAELLDRTLIWNQTHLRHALREYERHCNEHRTYITRRRGTPVPDRPGQQPFSPDAGRADLCRA